MQIINQNSGFWLGELKTIKNVLSPSNHVNDDKNFVHKVWVKNRNGCHNLNQQRFALATDDTPEDSNFSCITINR